MVVLPAAPPCSRMEGTSISPIPETMHPSGVTFRIRSTPSRQRSTASPTKGTSSP